MSCIKEPVGWTFMSTGPESKFQEIGRFFLIIASWFGNNRPESAFLFVDWWFSRYRRGGHECPPYGGCDELL